MRKLASIRKIKDVSPIKGADAIEKVVVDGWTLVSKKGEFSVGDPCVYFEIDSFLPADDPRFEFLKKSGVKKDPSGRERIRLKTIKLRGQISQGLALPLAAFPELKETDEGADVSETLGVIKFERPEPRTTDAAGNFPEFVPKTEEERVQNVHETFAREFGEEYYYPTLKLDGSSCTVVFLGEDMKDHWKKGYSDRLEVIENGEKKGEVMVCSRNLELKQSEDSHFWKAVTRQDLVRKMLNVHGDSFFLGSALSGSFAIQGEVMGPGVQGNKDKFNDFEFFAFSVYDIQEQGYLSYDLALLVFGSFKIQAVPTISDRPLKCLKWSLDDLLAHADGPGVNSKYREGVVWKPASDRGVSFKVISNKFLMKGGE